MNVRPLRPSGPSGPSGRSVRPSPVFLAIVAIATAGGVVAWQAGYEATVLAYVGVFTFVIFGWLVSLCLHEFGHAYTAFRHGDNTIEARGYLTLNPLKYSHPLLSLGLPVLFIALGGIGLPGGAVYVRTSWMTNRQKTTVSLAGPSANIVLAIVLLVATRLFFDVDHAVFWGGVAFLAFLQITAAILNLLPVPGLDGYSALEPHLSPQTQQKLEPVKQWGFFILLFVLFVPLFNQWFFSGVMWVFDLSGVTRGLVGLGLSLTQFWSAWR